MEAVRRKRRGQQRSPSILREASVRRLRPLDPPDAIRQRRFSPSAHVARQAGQRLGEELGGDVRVDVPSELALRQRAGSLHRHFVRRRPVDRPDDVLDCPPRIRLELAARSGMSQPQQRDAGDRGSRDVGSRRMRFRSPAPVRVLGRDQPRQRALHVRVVRIGLRRNGGDEEERGDNEHWNAIRPWHGVLFSWTATS